LDVVVGQAETLVPIVVEQMGQTMVLHLNLSRVLKRNISKKDL
jgi:hypothetical protein